MRTYPKPAWGKCDLEAQEFHNLAHHCADVAAVLIELLANPLIRKRAEGALGRPLTETEVRCLAALAFLHDIGKLAPGFQAKGWADRSGLRLRGHLECGQLWLKQGGERSLSGAMAHLGRWPIAARLREWFDAVLAHHGRPVAPAEQGIAAQAFPVVPGYDWRAEEAQLGRALLAWFPEITEGSAPPPEPVFLHHFCGLLTLADWIGSDRRAFSFERDFRADYWQSARDRAQARLQQIGLNAGALRLRGQPGWELISDQPAPRPAQAAVAGVPVSERLVLLEAETGSGKTEAALWRFAALLAAGEVDALYFAVPTRAAARQLQGRVNAAMARMFDPAPEAVLAIPGQATAGEALGQRLPDFTMLWDDEENRPARWAAEHSARYLAAQVAVGTVDQVALGGLQVKYAHLRGASLSRALLVIDEVHASDSYMTTVQEAMVRAHLDLGGHAMLMSATLGAAARRKWRREATADLATDTDRPYPALWTSAGVQAIAAVKDAGKQVRIEPHVGWSGEDAARFAIEAARKGARVLVIRNTVVRAQESHAAVLADEPELLLRVEGVPTLHHSRFAAEDRLLVDQAVEAALGKASAPVGRIVIGTQTLEQSLDICADLLITDLCPMDVLLQRIGRLHRHRRPRPAGFKSPRCIVLTPPGGLDPLTRRAENGLGASEKGPSLSGVYVNVPGLAATLAEIEMRPNWHIPQMNRALVEAATHPDALERIAEKHGWATYRQRVTGKALAEERGADLVLLDRTKPLCCFPDDEKIRTRLGEEGVVLKLPAGTVGAFGHPITRLALPAHWSQGLTGDEAVTVAAGPPIGVTVSDRCFTYSAEGLTREENHSRGAWPSA
jgi:CRISPR-associated endonuclease/helicase Cas3